MISTIVFPFFARSVNRASPLSKVLLARAPFTAIRRRKRRQRRLRRKRKKYKMPRRAGEESGSEGKTGFLYVVCYDGDAVHETASTRRRLYARGGMLRLSRIII